ncbi:MAG: TVP38/TMEM64 family protein [Roseiflexaceae bacterium]|nr:TVP38/TMEM64 family protein [Roseiflexaceae bacterium]
MNDAVPSTPPTPPTWLARNWQKLLAALIWAALIGSFALYAAISGRSALQILQDGVALLRTPLGPVLYVFIYMLRPLALFSATVLTLLGGAIWGPLLGTLYTIIGANLSATVAYVFGRLLGQGVLPEGQSAGVIGRYAERMRANAFSTVLVMRLIFLPYDLVNYLAGFLRVAYQPFILATIIGSLPGTLTFVLAGSSVDIDDIFAGRVSPSLFNPWALAASAALFVAGLAFARLLKRRDAS